MRLAPFGSCPPAAYRISDDAARQEVLLVLPMAQSQVEQVEELRSDDIVKSKGVFHTDLNGFNRQG